MALREMLLRGQLRPGERIRQIPLAAELKVSRIPLHLALERLAYEGLLEVHPRRGFIVQQFSEEDFCDNVELRGMLEGAAARHAAERISDPTELATLRASADEIIRLARIHPTTSDIFQRYIELNAEFHTELVKLSKSRMIKRAVERICLLPFASPTAFFDGPRNSELLWETGLVAALQHGGIVDALAAGEGMRAEALAREHARIALPRLQEIIKRRRGLVVNENSSGQVDSRVARLAERT